MFIRVVVFSREYEKHEHALEQAPGPAKWKTSMSCFQERSMACVLLDAVLTQVLSTLTPIRRHIDWVGWVGGSYVGVDEWLVGGREP